MVHKRYNNLGLTQKKQPKSSVVSEKEMKQANQHEMFTIDLAAIDGNGDFPCPGCKVTISPDDETESVYTIVDTRVKGESLEELTIQCNKCGSKIRLIGFVQ